MKLKQIIFCLLLALFSFNSSAEINIKFMINDQIVTNIDIINEKNYLIFLIATLLFSPMFFNILIKSFLLSSVKSGILSLIICPSI